VLRESANSSTEGGLTWRVKADAAFRDRSIE
jgi:hypothetical protein